MFRKISIIYIAVLVTCFYKAQSSNHAYYQELIKTGLDSEEQIRIKTKKSYLFTFDMVKLHKELKKVSDVSKNNDAVLLTLPSPDGSTLTFELVSNNVMHPNLAKKFPDVMTFDAYEINDPSIKAKLDLTPHGFHAMILRNGHSTIFIDPYLKSNNSQYISYAKEDFITDKSMKCEFSGKIDIAKMKIKQANNAKSFGTCELRTYRLALAATGEYTSYHGGTLALAQAAQVTTMNRVNGIFERDMAITMQIIPNNDLIIYTNASSDPYTNGSPGAMINENQNTVNSIIGSANYDIGHVFGTNSGGLAGLGVVCSNFSKARGVTGSANPIGDPFDVDYVSHEMGHQFGANHTFNNSCSGNRNDPTAIEPGSGNTIMAYAGICAPNTQSLSDDHFHGISLEEIEIEILSGGHSCPVITPLTNNAPVISSTNGNVTIPANTPFALTAIATDPDGDQLTYNWEQINNDITTQPPLSTSTGGPNFRSNPSLTSPTRYFPNLTDLANGGPFTWEVIPSVSRTMDFRVIVRDNALGGGCNDHADVTISTDAGSGPFVLTYPSASGITWAASSTETITWNVANTDNAPVNCTNVDLLLSIDGGATFSTTLASNVPNDGSEAILVPNLPTTTARVMVIAANGTFFDISDNDFTITGSICNDPDIPVIAGLTSACIGDTVALSISSGNLNDATDWQWYSGSCGGTLIGAGNSQNIIVTSSTQTIFVRGEGGCVVPAACAQHVISGESYNTTTTITTCGNYVWNGQTYSISGFYTDSLISVNGCDSIDNLDLTIAQNFVDTIVEVSCGNYIWNGQTYSSTGFYNDTIVSSTGCDSVLTLDLTISTGVFDSLSVISCSGYTWNGQTYNTTGFYNDTIASSTGCDSILTLDLTISPGTNDSIAVTACGSYTWNGQIYNNSGLYIDTLTSLGGCDSIVNLYLTIDQNHNDTLEVSSCTDYVWNGQTLTSNGFYTDSLLTVNGCDSVVTLDLTINNSSESPFVFTLVLDDYCLETTWELVNSANNLIYSGGPYDCFPNGGGNNANDTIIDTLYLNSMDCYTLTIYDEYDDGLGASFWGGTDGSWDLTDNLGVSIFNGAGNFGDSIWVDFMVTSAIPPPPVNVADYNSTYISVHPNPFSSNALLTLENVNFPFDLEIVDMLGKVVEKKVNLSNNKVMINKGNLKSGVYLLRINNNMDIQPVRIVIQ